MHVLQQSKFTVSANSMNNVAVRCIIHTDAFTLPFTLRAHSPASQSVIWAVPCSKSIQCYLGYTCNQLVEQCKATFSCQRSTTKLGLRVNWLRKADTLTAQPLLTARQGLSMYTRDSKTTVPTQRRMGAGAQGNKLLAGPQGCQALAASTMPQQTLQADSYTARAIALRACGAQCQLTLRTGFAH